MSHLTYGLLAGVLFGALSVALMLPISFPDRRTALTAAFLDRFAIGLVIGVVDLSWPAWSVGLFFGLLLSAPSALVTKTYKPILGMGAIGGLVIGLVLPHAVR
jgi:hypothetical protein